MTSRRSYNAILLLLVALVASCLGFQVIAPSAIQSKTKPIRTRPVFMAEESDDADNKTATTTEVKDIETPKFDAQDFEEESSGPSFDWFTVVLGAYVVFAISDSVFHITPDTPYIQMIIKAISGATGGDTGDAGS